MKKTWVIILLNLLLVLRCEFYEPPRDNRDDPNGDDFKYYIGGGGPGGGVVFYDKGSYSDGWRYIEVMLNTEKAPWGCQGTLINGADDSTPGGGIRNTIDIVTQCNEKDTAAYICANLTQNGYNDWYLPNRFELGNKDGVLRGKYPYFAHCGESWSSNQYTSYLAFFYKRSRIDIMDSKDSYLYVYCMRVF